MTRLDALDARRHRQSGLEGIKITEIQSAPTSAFVTSARQMWGEDRNERMKG